MMLLAMSETDGGSRVFCPGGDRIGCTEATAVKLVAAALVAAGIGPELLVLQVLGLRAAYFSGVI